MMTDPSDMGRYLLTMAAMHSKQNARPVPQKTAPRTAAMNDWSLMKCGSIIMPGCCGSGISSMRWKSQSMKVMEVTPKMVLMQNRSPSSGTATSSSMALMMRNMFWTSSPVA